MQLILIATWLASDSAVTRLQVYADDDALEVVSPQVAARIDVTRLLGMEAGWTADVITAASVDVRTAASPRGYTETRHEGHIGPRWRLWPGTDVHATYVFSTERDYRSHIVFAGGATELWQRRLTLSLVYRALMDRVGRAGEPTFAEPLDGHGGDVGAAVVVDPKTVAGMTYTIQTLNGFQASPYRFVPIVDPATSEVRASVVEATPTERLRHAITLDMRRALPYQCFARGLYRYYRDTWGIASHTGEAALDRAFLGDKATLGLRVRGYSQGAADFHEARYDTYPLIPLYRSADKKLGRNRSVLAGLRSDWSFGRLGPIDDTRIEASFDIYDQWFLDSPAIRRRMAAIVALGGSAQW